MLQISSNISLTALPTPHGGGAIFGIEAGQNAGYTEGENAGLDFRVLAGEYSYRQVSWQHCTYLGTKLGTRWT